MSELLDRMKLPEDIKKLSRKNSEKLAEEIREFLIKSVSETGGHLASNLGVVELTIALYKVFNFPEDKVVWDVGHQSYVHKILSGRKDLFPTLRKFGGMSGFPKTCESEYDCFNTGHSSTSVSAALGFARARDLKGTKENVVAVFGDGALTGGMLYEALNDAGSKKTKIILILNDNAMSISENVGSTSKHLRNLRAKPEYYKSKKRIEKAILKIPLIGKPLAKLIRGIKKLMRRIFIPPNMFDDLGLDYIGPVDGHNIEALTAAMEAAKVASSKPVLLHILTKKGKGYLPAEQQPQYFHGVSKFNYEEENFKAEEKYDYSRAFGESLTRISKENEDVVAITAAMPIGTGLEDYSKEFKNRFFDVGIAEQHAVTFAGGLAKAGKIPVVAVYSSFLQRAYDQVLHDVCLQNLHVVFCIDRAGVVGADGETHHGLYDVAFLSHLPNMAILSPSSFEEMDKMLSYAINEHNGPIAVRYPRGTDEFLTEGDFSFGKARVLKEGDKVTVLSCGRMMNTAKTVVDSLGKENISAELIKVSTITPLDEDTLKESFEKTKKAIVIEDHSEDGLSKEVAKMIATKGICAKLISFAYPKVPITHGKVEELDKLYGIDEKNIVEKIIEELKED